MLHAQYFPFATLVKSGAVASHEERNSRNLAHHALITMNGLLCGAVVRILAVC
jgi:hypothetical protein